MVVAAVVAVVMIVVVSPVSKSIRIVHSGIIPGMVSCPIGASPISERTIAHVPVERIPVPAAIPWRKRKVARVIVRHGSVSHVNAYAIKMWVGHIEIHIGKEGVVVAKRDIRPVEPSDPRGIGKVVIVAIIIVVDHNVAVFIIIVFGGVAHRLIACIMIGIFVVGHGFILHI